MCTSNFDFGDIIDLGRTYKILNYLLPKLPNKSLVITSNFRSLESQEHLESNYPNNRSLIDSTNIYLYYR
jgi:hypothetical protein